MKTRVLDSWAILEWINGREPADTSVDRLLAESEAGEARLLMSAINVGEVTTSCASSISQTWLSPGASPHAPCP
jgi:hypothetical protein